MKDTRMPKAVFYSQLKDGKRKSGGQFLRYRDVLKRHLSACDIPCDGWEDLALQRREWRNSIDKAVAAFETQRLSYLTKPVSHKWRVPCRVVPHPVQHCLGVAPKRHVTWFEAVLSSYLRGQSCPNQSSLQLHPWNALSLHRGYLRLPSYQCDADAPVSSLEAPVRCRRVSLFTGIREDMKFFLYKITS
ncbi:hypothetical protein K1T71_006857 [Dendrolimus kikuchii]|uniref:Uncharacterized protein n=1 Tax=Dendrolimus kikuchii TaxID=765133 RepID=A0ACC1D2M7_9NEOP|nr:hypothetical protein K1T71_006857 [Dendrolimus kikuchii]